MLFGAERNKRKAFARGKEGQRGWKDLERVKGSSALGSNWLSNSCFKAHRVALPGTQGVILRDTKRRSS